ncbi:MAG: Nif3-like dinuclear metal center hexameric protein [Clostridia bacterium]|nr:Nif3-like dinuclear metal center hexameric protein [Clostridia bacterium]
MAVIAADIYNLIDKIAPFNSRCDFDNVGILVGDATAQVKRIAVCLDITKDVVKRAAENECDLIVAHHPVIFDKLSSVTAQSIPYMLIKNGITAICAHTNLDCSKGGVNDRLSIALGIENAIPIVDNDYPDCPPIARIGDVSGYDPYDFAAFVKEKLNAPDVRFLAGSKMIRRVCVYGGAGNHFILQAKAAGADAIVTSEIKHHQWLEAKNLDITVIDAGHFSTENVVVKPLALLLKDKLDCEVRIISQSAPYQVV